MNNQNLALSGSAGKYT